MSSHSVALVGPGAIGGAVAGALFEAGHEPVVAARSGLERLIVEHPGGRIERDVEVTVDASDVSPVDVVFVAVKAQHSEDARPWLDALVGAGTTVVVLQNGVEHRSRFEPLVHAEAAVVPCVINLPAKRAAPGHVVVGGGARLTMEGSDAGHTAASMFDGSFISARAVDDWLTPAWTKLVLNAASGGLCTLTRPDNLVFLDEEARALAVEVMREVVAVGRAEGAALDDDLPDRIVEGLLARAGGHMASIVVDRIAGQPTEWQIRNEVVGRIAARHGIDVPLNRMLTTLIRLGEPPAPD